jgi:SRSO17 transposase
MIPTQDPAAPRLDWNVREDLRRAAYWTEVERRLAPYFERAEPRQRALAYLGGLIDPAKRKTSWQLAAASGDPTPYGVQHLLRRARWNPDAVCDALRRFILDHLLDPDAVLVLAETGFRKKGRHSAGVARQSSGIAGRVENCQVGVFLGYAGRRVQPWLDRELYIPVEWTDDPDRCRRAGIPEDWRFLTKPQLAQEMLARALDAGVPSQWVTGDRVYGDDGPLRRWLAAQPQAYVLAVSGEASVGPDGQPRRVNTLLAALPDDGWTRLSAGNGTRGLQWYNWRWLPLTDPMEPGWGRWLLVRRSVSDPQGRQAYVVFGPQDTTLEAVVQVAGTHGTMAREIDAAKDEVGLDHYEVRSWTGWYRHITLAMWALALLTAQCWGDGGESF